MSQNLEDLWLARKHPLQQARVNQVDQLRAREHVSHVMRDLESDPRWWTLAQHIDAESAELKKQILYMSDRMVGGEFLDPKDYGQLKLRLADLVGYQRGIDRALTMMAELVKSGDIAKQKIEELSTEK